MTWWRQLDHVRGSQPRCVLIMDGPREEVARRLTDLVGVTDVKISPDDRWMPYGKPAEQGDGTWDKTPAKEAKLGDRNPLLSEDTQSQLKNWWLEITPRANTPNWDIASTCRVHGEPGLLLVEAKAHHRELTDEAKGMKPGSNEKNRQRIAECIRDASQKLADEIDGNWSLDRDSHYQMSNRFAWSWKLTQLGYPVVLVYLGFLNATDVSDRGPLLTDAADWESAVFSHSENLVPAAAWGQQWSVNDQPLIPLIRAMEQPFDEYAEAVP